MKLLDVKQGGIYLLKQPGGEIFVKVYEICRRTCDAQTKVKCRDANETSIVCSPRALRMPKPEDE